MINTEILKNEIRTLSPACFALVMATGILTTAFHLQQYQAISNVLFWFNIVAFIVLLLLFILRLFLFFPHFLNDLSSHAKGAGFLTLVAGSCVLGTTYVQAKESYLPATVLWSLAVILWPIFVFALLAATMLKGEKPSPETGLSGNWFLLVVSTQSISILGSSLTPYLSIPQDITFFICLATFLLGMMLYIIIAPVITYRLLFFPVQPQELVPSYWICMGAAAITTLSGAILSENIRGLPLFKDLYFFVKGTSIGFWAVATFWIPLLVLMEVWKYVYKKAPLQYTGAFWSMAFPLGMYTVCTWRLAEATQFRFLQPISKFFLHVTWPVWLATFIGLCIHLRKTFFTSAAIE